MMCEAPNLSRETRCRSEHSFDSRAVWILGALTKPAVCGRRSHQDKLGAAALVHSYGPCLLRGPKNRRYRF